MTGQRPFDDPEAPIVWRVGVAPEASGRGPLLTMKATEAVLLFGGVLDLELSGQWETLQDGHDAVISAAVVSGWANRGRVRVEALWLLLSRIGRRDAPSRWRVNSGSTEGVHPAAQATSALQWLCGAL